MLSWGKQKDIEGSTDERVNRKDSFRPWAVRLQPPEVSGTAAIVQKRYLGWGNAKDSDQRCGISSGNLAVGECQQQESG